MEGLLSESGPYKVEQFSSPVTLSYNPYTWNNKTNNVWLESPAGVGFSYCTSSDACSSTDTSAAANNLLALQAFFAAYPELRSNDLWITGESYAGEAARAQTTRVTRADDSCDAHKKLVRRAISKFSLHPPPRALFIAGIYVPMLAYNVYESNIANTAPHINLKGIMVGNGCIGNAAGHCGNDPLNDLHDVTTFRGHGLISQKLADEIAKECDWALPSLVCDALLLEASVLTAGLDVYDLYNTCSDPASPAPPRRLRAPVGNRTAIARARAAASGVSRARVASGGPADGNCFGSGPTIESWANSAEVKAALHVAPKIKFELCSGNFSFNYDSDMADERAVIYPTLLTKANITVLIFNGEADLVSSRARRLVTTLCAILSPNPDPVPPPSVCLSPIMTRGLRRCSTRSSRTTRRGRLPGTTATSTSAGTASGMRTASRSRPCAARATWWQRRARSPRWRSSSGPSLAAACENCDDPTKKLFPTTKRRAARAAKPPFLPTRGARLRRAARPRPRAPRPARARARRAATARSRATGPRNFRSHKQQRVRY